MKGKPLIEYWQSALLQPVVPPGSFKKVDLSGVTFDDLEKFTARQGVDYLYGGYGEVRSIYSISALFAGEEPRRLHLGLDIWGPAGTLVFAAAAGTLHSAAYNEGEGNYGGTVILCHEAPGMTWHTLYGHLARESNPPVIYEAGDPVGVFGTPEENGNWPPHLHFQVILDMQGMHGDYPGVCRASESAAYLANCPDAGRLLEISLGL